MRISHFSVLATRRRARQLLFIFLTAVAVGGTSHAYAAWNGMPYAPEQTLDPECSPSNPNCRIIRPVTTGESIAAGSLAYTAATDTWQGLPIGSEGQVLKISGGTLMWGTDQTGPSYGTNEQGLHLATSTNTLSLVLDGQSLSFSGSGVRIASNYAGQTSITTVGTITSGTWQGSTILPQYGGTGNTTTPTNGQLLIGNSSSFSVGTLGGSNGIQITSGAGTLNVGLALSSLSSASTTADADALLLYQASSSTNKRISMHDFMATIAASANLSSVFGRTGTVTPQAGDYTAAQITNVASGTIVSTNLQSAINELAQGKEASILPGLSSQFWRGDKTWQTLDTLAVAENPVNLYFTNARARAAFASGNASLSYATSTGAITVSAGYNIPNDGTLQGDTLVWNGSQWTPTSGLMTLDTTNAIVSINGTASTSVLRVSTSAQIASSTITTLNSGTINANALNVGSLTLGTALSVASGGTGIANPTSAGLLIGSNTGGTWVQIATSSLNVALGDTTGTLAIARGGLGTSTAPTLGQFLLGNGLGGYTLTATSSLGINLSNISGTLGVSGGGTGTTTLPQGWLFSPGVGLSITASTTPTLPAITATSTTIASTFAGKIGIGTSSPIALLSITGSSTIPSLIVASTSGTSLAVAANGYVGIGQSNPTYPLDVKGDVGGTVARFQTQGGSLLCALSAVTGLLSCSSDERLKKDITSIDADALDNVLQLRPVSYHWKTDGSDAGLKYGFIAQEVASIFPELVTTDPTTGYLTLSVNGLMPFVVKSIQEQQAAIDALEAGTSSNSVSLTSLTQSDGLTFAGHVMFGADTVGEATIASGQDAIPVSFATPYTQKPVITLSPESEIQGTYWVGEVSSEGFTIHTSVSQNADTTFGWHAFGESQSEGSTPTVPTIPAAQPLVSSTTASTTNTSSTDPGTTTPDQVPTATPATSTDMNDTPDTSATASSTSS